jgi:hypothetical protein
MPVADHVIHLENGQLASDCPPKQVRQVVRHAVQNAGPAGIVVHFHGGLVSHSDGIRIAERLRNVYESAGASPVFFVWESGLLETLRNNLAEIAEQNFFKLLWKRVAAIVLRKFHQDPRTRAAKTLPALDTRDTESAIDTALTSGERELLGASERPPPDWLTELSDSEKLDLEAELKNDAELMTEVREVSNGLLTPTQVAQTTASRAPRVRGSSRTLMDPEALEGLIERSRAGDRGIISTLGLVRAVISVAARVIARYVRKRDHGVHATVVEEILRAFYVANVGARIWSTIKKDTADAFEAGGGGTVFLEALNKELGARAPAAPPAIRLVGHSAGSIYISRFIDKAATQLPPDACFDVAFLAPAATFDVTAATLRRHARRITGFRMFAMADEYERGDRLVPVLYPHSLLYFVCGVIEDPERGDVPIVGMQRFYDHTLFDDARFADIKTVRDYIHVSPPHGVWSVTGASAKPGRRSKAEKHGDFDNDVVTLHSVAYILKSGF